MPPVRVSPSFVVASPRFFRLAFRAGLCLVLDQRDLLAVSLDRHPRPGARRLAPGPVRGLALWRIHAVDCGGVAPPFRRHDLSFRRPRGALHLAVVLAAGRACVARVDGLAPVGGGCGTLCCGPLPCPVRRETRGSLTGQTGEPWARAPQAVPAPSQHGCRATRVDARAGPQRADQRQKARPRAGLPDDGWPQRVSLSGFKCAQDAAPGAGGRQLAPAACRPPGVGTPAGAVTGAVRGRGPKPPRSNCATPDF